MALEATKAQLTLIKALAKERGQDKPPRPPCRCEAHEVIERLKALPKVEGS